MNNYMAATDEKQWADFLGGMISEGAFKNVLRAQEVLNVGNIWALWTDI